MNSIDIAIIIFYILAIFSVGFFLRGKINSFSEFMIANSKMGVALGVASMAGTELGLITVMYNAQKGWSGQFASFHIGLIAFFVTLAIGLSGFVISKLRDFNVKSIPEFYNIRYGKNVRIIGAIFLILAGSYVYTKFFQLLFKCFFCCLGCLPGIFQVCHGFFHAGQVVFNNFLHI